MNRRGRPAFIRPGVLAFAAALLLAAGLWGPARRAYESHRASQAAVEAQAKAAADRLLAADELKADKPAVLARIRDLQEHDDHPGALRLASRYRDAKDPDVEALFQRSVAIQGGRMRVAADRALLRRLCVEGEVAPHLDTLFTLDAPGGVHNVTSDVKATRATSADDVTLVRQRLMSADPGLDLSDQGPAAAAGEAHVHRIQVHPLTATALLDPAQDPQPLLCVWNVEGVRNKPSGPVAFRMKLWMAPRPGSMLLSAEPLAYEELAGPVRRR